MRQKREVVEERFKEAGEGWRGGAVCETVVSNKRAILEAFHTQVERSM